MLRTCCCCKSRSRRRSPYRSTGDGLRRYSHQGSRTSSRVLGINSPSLFIDSPGMRGSGSSHVKRSPAVDGIGFMPFSEEHGAHGDVPASHAAAQQFLFTIINQIVFRLKFAPLAVHPNNLLSQQSRSALQESDKLGILNPLRLRCSITGLYTFLGVSSCPT